MHVLFCFLLGGGKVVAKSYMPDSVEPRGRLWRDHKENRLESVRIVWPSRQYIEACRDDM